MWGLIIMLLVMGEGETKVSGKKYKAYNNVNNNNMLGTKGKRQGKAAQVAHPGRWGIQAEGTTNQRAGRFAAFGLRARPASRAFKDRAPQAQTHRWQKAGRVGMRSGGASMFSACNAPSTIVRLPSNASKTSDTAYAASTSEHCSRGRMSFTNNAPRHAAFTAFCHRQTPYQW